jgi:hypothetical protein
VVPTLFVLNAQFGKVGPIFVDSACCQLNPSDLDAPRLDQIPPGILIPAGPAYY